MAAVELYLDFSCPWSYLALLRLQDVCERTRATLLLKPVSIDEVLATENPALAAERLSPNPNKAAWQRKDLNDWSAFWGVTLELGPDWPRRRAPAAAAAQAVADTPQGFAFCRELYRLSFGEGADIDSVAVLQQAADSTGVDSALVAAAAEDADAKAKVSANGRELISRGGFGTPTMLVGDALFFGNDRVPLIEWTLGPMSDEAFVMPGQHDVY